MATDIFSVIQGLTVTKDEILEAETFTEQFLSAAFPTYDFRQGTGLRDMTVRPNATLLALVDKAIRYYFDTSDISNITNTTDASTVDERLSNFFVTRKTGTNAVVRARLQFSFPSSSPIVTTVPSSAWFSTDNSLRYNPEGLITINPPVDTPEQGKYYFRLDSSTGLWYVDINLRSATQSTDANKQDGDLLYFSIFSPYFIRASIQYLVTEASATETNEEMVSRAYTSISTRNLINTPSIISKITDDFNYVNGTLPVGLGDPLMYRDIIGIDDVDNPGTTREYHRGGMTDIYVDTNPVLQSVQLTFDADGLAYVSGPVFSMRRATTAPSDKDPDTLPVNVDFNYAPTNVSKYTNSIPDTPADDIGLSARQITRVHIPSAVAGETATFDIQAFSGVTGINNAINGKDQRVVCADYLTRSFEPFFVDMAIETRSTDATKYEAAIAAVRSYINDIPNGGTLYVSSIISAIQSAGVTDVVMPVTATVVNKHKYIQYDTTDDTVIDETVISVTDDLDLQENQVFYPRTITLAEEA